VKPLIAQGLIVASALAAIVLGYRNLRGIYLIVCSAPEETAFFGWSLTNFLRWLPIFVLPIALYVAGFAVNRDSVYSFLGKVGLCLNITYLIIVIVGSVYVFHFISPLGH
jgi:hypothetical protein